MVAEIEKRMKIETRKSGLNHFVAEFDLPGVSIAGYGKNETEAKYNLLLRLMVTSVSHIDKVLESLGVDPGVLELRADYEPTEIGLELMLRDRCGRRCITKSLHGREVEIAVVGKDDDE